MCMRRCRKGEVMAVCDDGLFGARLCIRIEHGFSSLASLRHHDVPRYLFWRVDTVQMGARVLVSVWV
jgi:hypothetical protein